MILQAILIFLAFGAMAGISFFLWQKGKAQSALLMLIGFGLCALVSFFTILKVYIGGTDWIFACALVTAAGGFFLTFQSRIQAQLDALKAAAMKDKEEEKPTEEEKSEDSE